MVKMWGRVKTSWGQEGKVVAVSGTDQTCIVRFTVGDDEEYEHTYTGWIKMSSVSPVK